MGFFEDLDASLDIQRQEKESRSVHDSVPGLHELVPVNEKEVNNTIVAVELCVVDVAPFSKGWHYALTNKIAATNFSAAKKKIADLQGAMKEEFLFHLTVWQPPKRHRDEKTIPPGCLLFSDAVTGFTRYKTKHQGETPHAAVMKIEKAVAEAAEAATVQDEGAKKTKKDA